MGPGIMQMLRKLVNKTSGVPCLACKEVAGQRKKEKEVLSLPRV